MTHEDMQILLAGLVFHAQESCGSQKRYEDLGEFEKKVEELINKDMPTKPSWDYDIPYCGACNGDFEEENWTFCPHCGHKVDWSELE
jgi:hypothetical protein